MMRPADKKAQALLQKYSIKSAPIPVEDIAHREGAEIARLHFEGQESGFILRESSRIIIGVNTRTSIRRQRFTIAHEIGHLLLHEGKPLIIDRAVRLDWRDERSSSATDTEEIEANAFAAGLLMPSDLLFVHLKRYIQELQESNQQLSRDDLIAHVARIFNVSSEAMGYRLINLGILTAAV